MAQKGDLLLVAVGDIGISRSKPASIFAGVRGLLRQADVVMGNQEGACTDRGAPFPGKVEVGSVNHRAPPDAAAAQAEAGFSAMSLANNHMMDFGAEGLFQNIELLRENGIACTGAGASPKEARQPAVLERKGVKVAMLSYTSVFPPGGYAVQEGRPGVATVRVNTAYQAPYNAPYQPGTPAITVTTPDPAEMASMLADVRAARPRADFLAVHFHWGVAGMPRNLGYMKMMARAAIDAGADMVLGHHPHILLGVELYQGKPICYSLGHFAFDGRYNFKEAPHGPGYTDSMALKAHVRDGRFERLSVVPIVLDPVTVALQVAGQERRRAILESLTLLSDEFGTTFTQEGEELAIGGPAPGTPPPSRGPEALADHVFSWTPATGCTIGPTFARKP